MKTTMTSGRIADILSDVGEDDTAIVFGPCTCGKDECDRFSVVLAGHDKVPFENKEVACASISKENIPWFIASLFEIYIRWDEAKKIEHKAMVN